MNNNITIYRWNESTSWAANSIQEVYNLIKGMFSLSAVTMGPYSEYHHFVCDTRYLEKSGDRCSLTKTCDQFTEALAGETCDLVKYRIVHIPYSTLYSLKSMFRVANFIVNNYNDGGYTACVSITEDPAYGYHLLVLVTTVNRYNDQKGFLDETAYLERAVLGWYKSVVNAAAAALAQQTTEQNKQINEKGETQ